MAQRGNRPKHVAGVKRVDDVPQAPEEVVENDPNVVRTSGGGGMGRTSPKLRKTKARSSREATRDASVDEPGVEALDDDFRTVRVPGPGPRDTDAGRATTKQLETHELTHGPGRRAS
jgi:hypothetical protein